MSSAPHKKNLGGGKGHKKRSNKEHAGPRKNRELTVAFVEDIKDGETIEGLTLAKVQKMLGGARAELITLDGKATIAGLKGSLKCKAGGARRADNPIALFPGSYVLLQDEGYSQQIIGILSRPQAKLLEKYFPDATKGFFNMTGLEEDADFDWDEEDVDVEEI
jgi:hypothetical protein